MRTFLLLATCAVLLPAQAQQPSTWELQERHEREKRELKRQQEAQRQAQKRRTGQDGGCVYKSVMTEEDLRRCRSASRKKM